MTVGSSPGNGVLEMGSMTAAESTTSKGERTRSAIIDAALSLFEERGYDATTMRAVAERAGVSTGNAYYYFRSKEQLVQGFYDRAAERHDTLSVERLTGRTDLGERIYHHLDAWFELMADHHEFAGQFFRTAADPSSPMSPFSAESAPARDAAIARWQHVVDGAEVDLDPAITAELPGVLWLYQMGLILFWVHDRSRDQIATRMAIAHTVPLLTRLIALVEVPELRGAVDDILALVTEVRAAVGTAGTAGRAER